MQTFTNRYARPFTTNLPPLPLADQSWTHAWIWENRVVALAPGGLIVADRGMPDLDDLPAEMPWVDRLIAVVGGTPAPEPAPDWAATEARLGTRLPGDYKKIVETYGAQGLFDGFYRVLAPHELLDHTGTRAGDHPPFPAKGGALPWSNNEEEDLFFWITEDEDPDRWPVYAVDNCGDETLYEGSAAQYLLGLMTDPDNDSTPAGHWFMGSSR
ncbi:SMI1/KNR4 family protein [Spirillospora sp. NPDC047279]|uniref:SMI1/KNR4 family protein n=1 Tax=Spirillospora sp. NPDC047279 TaxID=3155478 RepID=UPI0033FA3C23